MGYVTQIGSRFIIYRQKQIYLLSKYIVVLLPQIWLDFTEFGKRAGCDKKFNFA